ncbi:MAG: hypothetical protein FWC43_07265 [Planctomycetaceae bacterium]|nr:hypothetical protein [Planctomycetaceae bacterium]
MSPILEKTFPFTVDLPGMIDLMGTSLYSEPSAAIRELIQKPSICLSQNSKSKRRIWEVPSADSFGTEADASLEC